MVTLSVSATTRLAFVPLLLLTILTNSSASPPHDSERRVLDFPMDDPMHAETVRAVMGCRVVEALDASRLRMVFGGNFGVGEARNNPSGFEIFSPTDPNYAFEEFVKPLSVQINSLPDVVAGFGPMAAYIRIHQADLRLPTPMIVGHVYYARATGGRPRAQAEEHYKDGYEGIPITSCRNAGSVTFGDDAPSETEPDETTIQAVMGLRGVQVVSDKGLKLIFGAATEPSEGAGDYSISSVDDDAFAGGLAPTSVSRLAIPEHIIPGWPWPFPLRFLRHEIYLELPSALREGKTYTISTSAAITSGRRTAQITYSDLGSHNPHIKTNHYGYVPESPVKWGYLGAWTGLGGVIDYSSVTEFRVVDADTGEVRFTGTPTLRKRGDARDEGVYDERLAGEDLYVLDFTEFRSPGEYYLVVPGMGRSHRFRVGPDVYGEPFRVAMRGLFYQRCGMAMGPPDTEFRRVACHLEPKVEYTTVDDYGAQHNAPFLENLIPGKPARRIVGGHHDAGDYLPRAHFEVAEYLMRVYEMYPEKFGDGQLDVPESANGLPDILDEAAWALQVFEQLQEEDGGVPSGIESAGDPNFVETPERDPLRQFAYAKNAKGGFTWAACAAQASRLWSGLGRDDEGALFLTNAVRAYDWALAHTPESFPYEWEWAAAELARTTGEARYSEHYANAGAEFKGEINKWRGTISYALNDHPQANASLRSAAKDRILALCQEWIANAESFAYPFMRHPWAPISWGAGSYPGRLLPLTVAHYLTGEAKYLRWHVHACDIGLGANPLNLTYTTGLGHRSIHGPMHLWGWHNYQGLAMPGLQCEGPMDPTKQTDWLGGLYPPPEEWPTFYAYFDFAYNPPHNEGVVLTQAVTAAAYAALLPDFGRTASSTQWLLGAASRISDLRPQELDVRVVPGREYLDEKSENRRENVLQNSGSFRLPTATQEPESEVFSATSTFWNPAERNATVKRDPLPRLKPQTRRERPRFRRSPASKNAAPQNLR